MRRVSEADSTMMKKAHNHHFLSSELDDMYTMLVQFRLHKHTQQLCEDWAILREPFFDPDAHLALQTLNTAM